MQAARSSRGSCISASVRSLCRNETLELISGSSRSPGSMIFTFTCTVALARSAVGMIWRSTPFHF